MKTLNTLSSDEQEKIKAKQEHEIHTVGVMIGIYCKDKHKYQIKNEARLCPECQKLMDYVTIRTKHCPHMAEKTFCSACKTHCYAPAKRKQIQEVMRYSGPRMMFHAPLLALYHWYIQLKMKFEK